VFDLYTLYHLSFYIYLFRFSTCFEQPCAHHQESQLYQYNIWYMSLCVGECPVCRWSGTVTYTVWHIPDVVLIQLTLLMMSTRLLETYKEPKNIYTKGIQNI